MTLPEVLLNSYVHRPSSIVTYYLLLVTYYLSNGGVLEIKSCVAKFISVLAVLSITASCGARLETGGAVLRVGVGEGILGLMLKDVADAESGSAADIELHTFIDCCGSAAQWAMSSGELDIGFYCISISQTLINFNNELEIYGPAAMNSEVLALAEGVETPASIAIPLKRSFLDDLVYSSYPSATEILQVTPIALNNALSGNHADAAVLDIAQAIKTPDAIFAPIAGEQYVSYCMVVRKECIATPEFAAFVEAYNRVADDYNDHGYMTERYGMDSAFWEMVNLKLLHLQ